MFVHTAGCDTRVLVSVGSKLLLELMIDAWLIVE